MTSLLVETPRLDIAAINADFQKEHDELEERSTALDREFQKLVKELRLWIVASLEPASTEARIRCGLLWLPLGISLVRIAKEVETIKKMEERQEDVQPRICIIGKLIKVTCEDGRLHESCRNRIEIS